MSARRTELRFDVRFTDARPMRTLGVPPMRSSVQNEKPLSPAPARANDTSAHSSACLDSRPASNRLGPSAQMSAISTSSASLSWVQSLVVTSIAMFVYSPYEDKAEHQSSRCGHWAQLGAVASPAVDIVVGLL